MENGDGGGGGGKSRGGKGGQGGKNKGGGGKGGGAAFMRERAHAMAQCCAHLVSVVSLLIGLVARLFAVPSLQAFVKFARQRATFGPSPHFWPELGKIQELCLISIIPTFAFSAQIMTAPWVPRCAPWHRARRWEFVAAVVVRRLPVARPRLGPSLLPHTCLHVLEPRGAGAKYSGP